MKTLTWLLVGTLFATAMKAQKPISADTLYRHATQYVGKTIVTEGKIVHVCPIGGAKMKLYTAENQIIKVNANSFTPLPKTYNGQILQICGTVSIEQLSSSQVDQNEKAGKSLCHIDETPCLDNKLQDRLQKEGRSQKVAKRDADRVRKEMEEQSKSDYVTVVINLTKQPIVLDSVTP